MQNAANLTMSDVTIRDTQSYVRGGAFYFTETSDATNSYESEVIIKDSPNIYRISSWYEAGFMYIDNPNANITISKCLLDEIDANLTAGVW